MGSQNIKKKEETRHEKKKKRQNRKLSPAQPAEYFSPLSQNISKQEVAKQKEKASFCKPPIKSQNFR
jgi:hypothetical protein